LPDIASGAPYVVGARSPTPAISTSSGRIIPNSSMNGGAIIYNISQDNRGTDPVLVEQRTRQGLIASHNASVSNALAAQVEFQKRSPQ
jgi:hypothetical protein